MRATLLALFAACAHAPVPVLVDGCRLDRAPPARPHVAFAACPGYELCLHLGDAAELDRYVGDVDAWADDAWTKCGR